MNNSRPNFCSCPDPVLPVCQAKLLRHFICHLWLLSEREGWARQWHNAAKYPLWLRSWQYTGSGSDGPESSQTGCCRIGICISLSLLLSELTLGPTVEREQHLKVGIVKIGSITPSQSQHMTSGSVTWFVTHRHVLRVSCLMNGMISSRVITNRNLTIPLKLNLNCV